MCRDCRQKTHQTSHFDRKPPSSKSTVVQTASTLDDYAVGTSTLLFYRFCVVMAQALPFNMTTPGLILLDLFRILFNKTM